ncbi:MAG TPA: MFS transporter [Solirubrobacteraceae bacterium]|nr:MFS transporter [Solirubrobacteraceae bacterium]
MRCPRIAFKGVLRRRDVRALWFGETVSELGTTVSSLAVPLVAIVALHAGAFAVSMLMAAAWLPWLLIGLPAGAWVDRLPARPVMIVADLVAAGSFASVPVAAALGVLTLAQLLLCALLGGCAAVFFQTAYRVFLPAMIDGPDLAGANALMHGSQSAAQVGGPGIAGLLAGAVGAVGGVLLNALSFLVSAACLRSLRDGPQQRPTRPRGTLRSEIADGARWLIGDPYQSVLTVWGGLANFALVGYQAVLVVFLVHDVRLTPGAVGALMALSSVGGVAGAAVAPRLGPRFGTARAFIGCELVAAPAALLVPLAAPGPRTALFAVGGFLVIAGVVAGNVLNATWSQTYVPRELRGRVCTCSALVNYGGIPLGALCAGALAAALGTHGSIWVMTALLALCPALLLVSPLRGHRDFPAAGGDRRRRSRRAAPRSWPVVRVRVAPRSWPVVRVGVASRPAWELPGATADSRLLNSARRF